MTHDPLFRSTEPNLTTGNEVSHQEEGILKLMSSINRKVMAGYSVILLLFTVAIIFSVGQTSHVEKGNQQFIMRTLPSLEQIEQASASIQSLQIAAYALYGTTLEIEDFNRQRSHLSSKLSSTLIQVEQTAQSLRVRGSYSDKSIMQQISRLQAIMSANSVDWDGARAVLEQLDRQVTQLQGDLAQLKTAVSDQATQQAKNIAAQLQQIRLNLIAAGVATLLIIILALVFSRRSIALPVISLSKQLDKLVLSHDLSKPVTTPTHDEIATTTNSINQLLQAFRDTSCDTQKSSLVLLNSATELRQLAASSDTQIGQLSATLSALLNQIAAQQSHIEQSSQNSLQASETAQRGASEVREGAESVRQSATHIATLAEDIDRSSEMLSKLQSAGDQVGSVVKTIAEIAEQTNLLALNAAIEAARAGESGRGFAVVADEVRTLANRTHQSTTQINQILDAIVSSISAAITNMDANKQQASKAVSVSEQTVDSLQQIEATINDLSGECHHLAEMATQMNQEAVLMRDEIDGLRETTAQVSHGSSQNRAQSESLTQLAATLKEVASRFTV